MRADAHYVDQLVAPARRVLETDDIKPAAVVTKAAPSTPPSQAHTSKLNEEALVTSLSAVLSCTDLLADGMPQLTRAVAVNMIRAEAQRAICALRTAHLLQHGIPTEKRLIDPRTVLARVVDVVTPETRLRGCRVSTTVDVPDSVKLRADETTLVHALASAALMLAGGLHDVQGARLDLKVAWDGSSRMLFSLAQEYVILPDACLKIFSTPSDGGSVATAPFVALRDLAAAYGGSATAGRLAHGTQVTLDLPASELS